MSARVTMRVIAEGGSRGLEMTQNGTTGLDFCTARGVLLATRHEDARAFLLEDRTLTRPVAGEGCLSWNRRQAGVWS